MIKIAFIIDTIATEAAGTEKQLLMLLNGLDRSKFQPHLVCLRKSRWLDENRLSFPLHVLTAPSLLSIGTPFAIHRFAQYLRENDFDLVHAHYFDSVLLTAIATRCVGCTKLVTSRRGFIDSENVQRTKQIIYRRIGKYFDSFVCNSQALATFVARTERISVEKIHVIYNGINVEKLKASARQTMPLDLPEQPANKSAIRIVSIANLRPVKNIQLLIRAASKLTKRHTSLDFVVIGEGDQRPHLEDLIKQSGLKECFHLIGTCANPEKILARSNISVLTSSSESLSNSLIEYAAIGLPTVASDVGGNMEVVEDGKTGFIFRSGDLDDLVVKLERLIVNKDMRRVFGLAAEQNVSKKFPVDLCLARYEKLYQTIVDNNER